MYGNPTSVNKWLSKRLHELLVEVQCNVPSIQQRVEAEFIVNHDYYLPLFEIDPEIFIEHLLQACDYEKTPD